MFIISMKNQHIDEMPHIVALNSRTIKQLKIQVFNCWLCVSMKNSKWKFSMLTKCHTWWREIIL